MYVNTSCQLLMTVPDVNIPAAIGGGTFSNITVNPRGFLAHKGEEFFAFYLTSGTAGGNSLTAATYSCFETDDPLRFVGILEFEDDAGKAAFTESAAFATYRDRVGPTFANPPETTDITGIASTFG